jgi:polysaccharide biosynthesis/export protein
MLKAFTHLLLLCMGFLPALAYQAKAPKELMEFVQAAKSLGLSDLEIKKSAVNAGWKLSVVEQLFVENSPDGKLRLPGASPEAPETHRIGAGDVLQVVVWKEPDASVPEAAVRADGKITLPLLKEVDVVGYTPSELEKILAEKLKHFINAADVTVVIKQIRSRKAYLVGAVRKEGPIQLDSPMTVLQAIVEGGGLTDYAKKKRIYILRNDNGRQVRLPFDYEAVIRGEGMEQNIMVLPEDTIVVPY